MQRALNTLWVLIVVATHTWAGEVPEVFDRMVESRGKLQNYVLEYKSEVQERVFSFDRDGSPKFEDRFVEYEATGNAAYDRGKYMYDTTQPFIANDSVVEGQYTNRKGVYNGSRLIQQPRPNLFHVTTKNVQVMPKDTPFNIFQHWMNYLAEIEKRIESGSTVVQEQFDGHVHEVTILSENGYKSVWKINADKGYAPESIRQYYPSGALCHETIATNTREFAPGVWLPETVTHIGYMRTGEIQVHYEHSVVEAHVNLPDIDPGLFEITIPQDARVYDVDLGVWIPPPTGPGGIASAELEALAEMDKMATEDQQGSPGEPDRPPTDKDATGDLADDRGTGRSWITYLVILFVLLGVLALVAQKRMRGKRPV